MTQLHISFNLLITKIQYFIFDCYFFFNVRGEGVNILSLGINSLLCRAVATMCEGRVFNAATDLFFF